MSVQQQSFTKVFDRDVDIEAAKATALHALSIDWGFKAPEVLSVDAQGGRIEFEYLTDLVSVRQCFIAYMSASQPDTETLVPIREAGAVLGRIHASLHLHTKHIWQPSSQFRQALVGAAGPKAAALEAEPPMAYLHGDYGFSNVFTTFDRGRRVIAVLDASPNHYSTQFPDSFGPVYVDLGSFTACLDGLVPLRWYPWMHWKRLREVKESFARGYEEVTGTRIDRRILSCYAYATASSYLGRKYSRPARALAMRCLMNRFKGNLPGVP